jgi:uncharacterized OB-fold protein
MLGGGGPRQAPAMTSIKRRLIGMVAGDTKTVHYECRDCGTTVPPDAECCEACGSDEIVRVNLQ